MIRELSLGHLGARRNLRRSDELGALADTMDRFADTLHGDVVSTLQRLAAGDLTTTVAVKDSGDEIGPAMQKITESLRALVAEMTQLTDAARQGRLTTRGDEHKYQGSYRQIVEGVNSTLDAVVGPLNVAAGYVDRISKGDIPAAITAIPVVTRSMPWWRTSPCWLGPGWKASS